MTQMTQISKSCARSCLHGSHKSHGSQVKIRADTRDTPETKFHGAQNAQVYMIIPEIRWSRKSHRKAVVRCTLYSKLLHSLKTSPAKRPYKYNISEILHQLISCISNFGTKIGCAKNAFFVSLEIAKGDANLLTFVKLARNADLDFAEK